ncbi:conserved membrane hypothetical protein [Flavobacterium sp. 9AF]|uniref:hypothetical protein n=1 Tax=Flavobacterium sp. 9AF TaxID=2653142 RepID=UPI0012F28692|nr:hypothetical protein [Flavobacterium sp. 9AF]VXB06040.1 conserved membrane hypothetical protein [Flavobacterium sp. 9AF]
MSFLTIIKDLKINKKTIFFSVLGQTYYFLIAFFLFRPDYLQLIDENYFLDFNFYFLILVSFFMSIIWFLMNISVTAILLLLSNKENTSSLFINAMICSIGYLTFAMVLNFLLDYDFRHFISFAFSFIAIRIIWTIIRMFLFNKSLV